MDAPTSPKNVPSATIPKPFQRPHTRPVTSVINSCPNNGGQETVWGPMLSPWIPVVREFPCFTNKEQPDWNEPAKPERPDFLGPRLDGGDNLGVIDCARFVSPLRPVHCGIRTSKYDGEGYCNDADDVPLVTDPRK
jgi:hypothetical protein